MKVIIGMVNKFFTPGERKSASDFKIECRHRHVKVSKIIFSHFSENQCEEEVGGRAFMFASIISICYILPFARIRDFAFVCYTKDFALRDLPCMTSSFWLGGRGGVHALG